MGGANCVQNTRSAFPGPRQLPVVCNTLTASNGKLGKGLGKKLVARGVSAYQSRFQPSCFTLHSTTVWQQNGQQVADKSKEMRRCQRVVAIL